MMDILLILGTLGALFLVLGVGRCLRAHSISGQGRTWVWIGMLFCAVALWLHWSGAPLAPRP